MDALLNSLSEYFPSISVDQYNWVRNPFVEFEPWQGQFTLKEEEELVSVASDRMLKLKHAELNLDAFWLLVENECPAIAERESFATSVAVFHFLYVRVRIFCYDQHQTQETRTTFCLSKMNFVNIRPRIKLLLEITKHKFRTEMFATANW